VSGDHKLNKVTKFCCIRVTDLQDKLNSTGSMCFRRLPLRGTICRGHLCCQSCLPWQFLKILILQCSTVWCHSLQQFHVMMISLRILDNTSQRKHGSPARRLREHTDWESSATLVPEWCLFSQSARLPSSPGWHLCDHYLVDWMLHVVLWVLYPAQCQPFDTVCSDVAIVARLWLSVLDQCLTFQMMSHLHPSCHLPHLEVQLAVTTVEWESHLRIPTTSQV